MSQYVLRTGLAGAGRLRFLAAAAWPQTLQLLERAGLRPGWRCLDVGCGLAGVSVELARRCGSCLAVDRNGDFLARVPRVPGLELVQGELDSLRFGAEFDLVYARYLLSHLPAGGLARLSRFCRPGGWLVVEDVDFPLHVCDPECAAFARYVELYQCAVLRRGGNPRLGRELGRLAAELGFEVVHFGVQTPSFREGAGKRIAELTLAHVAGALLDFGLSTRGELAGLLRELRAFRRRPDSMMSLAPTFQLIARVPG